MNYKLRIKNSIQSMIRDSCFMIQPLLQTTNYKLQTLVFLLVTCYGLLVTSSVVYAADADIVINEIAAAEKTGHEWFEIYNKGTTSVDLNNWKVLTDATTHKISAYRGDLIIDPGEYAIISDVASTTEKDYPQFTGTLIDSSWSSLLNDGMLLGLQNSKGDIIEFFIYQPMKKYSLERKDPLSNDYSVQNWSEHKTGNTVGVQNSNYQPPVLVPPPPSQTQQQDTQTPLSDTSQQNTPTQQAVSSPQSLQSLIFSSRGDVVINEFVPDPVDEEKEWVELYNTTQHSMLLDGWTLEDGSKKKIHLKGTMGISDKDRFFVIEVGDSVLNNGGDKIILRDSLEKIIDDVSYGSWDDGDVKNNAPTAHDPFSIARMGDGINTYNNSQDFQVTTTLTRGSANTITKEDSLQNQEKKTNVQDIVFSELYPNPISNNLSDEFIELYNNGNTAIDLLHWELESGNSRRYIIRENDFQTTIVQPHSYFIISRAVSTLALRNKGGDTISLFKPEAARATVKVSYRENADKGVSYIRLQDGTYDWTLQPTPNSQNISIHKNSEPVIILDAPKEVTVGERAVFDASDTSDPDNDHLSFFWDFGTGERREGMTVGYTYQKDGTYAGIITVSDGLQSVEKLFSVRVKKKETSKIEKDHEKVFVVNTSQEIQQSEGSVQGQISQSFILNEVFPNPVGKDTGEFIELKNISSNPVENSNFGISLKGSGKIFHLNSGITSPQEYLLLNQKDYHFSLRNTKDTLTLTNSNGISLDSVSYEKAPSGYSYARMHNGQWKWTQQTTPGGQNGTPQNQSLQNDGESYTAGDTLSSDIHSVPSRTHVQIKGVVSVAPNILSASFFYLANPDIQVYSSSHTFPHLKEGDSVEVQGVMGSSNGEKRIRVVEKNSVIVLAHHEPPTPQQIELSEISEDREGQLVKIAGEVTEARMPHYVLEKGDDMSHVYIRKNTNIKKPDVRVGDSIEVKGIIQKIGDEYRILPRYDEDIALLERKKPVDSTVKTVEPISTNTDSQNQTMQYIIATVVTALAVGAGLFIQYKKK